MTAAIRWRIMALQAVAVLVLAFVTGAAFFASNFVHDQVKSSLDKQQITFSSTVGDEYSDLSSYAGKKVTDGNLAYVFAYDYLGRHLARIGTDSNKVSHPYSYWSGLAQAEKDPATKAKYSGIADTLFKGTTLQTMLIQAWTFWVVGDIAFYVGIAFLVATLLVLVAFVFELVISRNGSSTAQPATATAKSES
jgi:hypothetical protein